ncbi:MAG: hypothetical protein NT069_23110 [Planctomycetota bacterium]|nr:hypothetical protein [Planctomycetota bacterium]
MIRLSLRHAACVVAVGATLVYSQSFAKGPLQADAKPANKTKPIAAQGAGAEAAIPACLENLKLSATQQTQAREIVHKFDASIDATWKTFGEKYMETVRTEVVLLATIEDTLTDKQRAQVREERRRVAHAEKLMEGTSTKPNKATAEPADAADQVVAAVGITLTDEQESAADKIHEKYVGHLRSLNRDIQGLHNRLISLEADRMVELEKMLTKEQLAELRHDRQAMTNHEKLTSITAPATKPKSTR